jgi:LemA protein
MTATALVPALVAAVLVLWMLGAYNRLVRQHNLIHHASTQIDEQLRRRAEALPALLHALHAPLAGERAALEAVADAAAQQQAATAAWRGSPTDDVRTGALARSDAVLASAVQRLLALLDQQPVLRELVQVALPLRELHDADLRLAFARQAFNDAVDVYNAALEQFPTRLLRRAFGLRAAVRL